MGAERPLSHVQIWERRRGHGHKRGQTCGLPTSICRLGEIESSKNAENASPVSVRDGKAIAKGAGNIADNALKGKQGEALTQAKLGDNVAGKQVSFRTSDGSLSRPDFVTKDGRIVETKTDGASLTGTSKSSLKT